MASVSHRGSATAAFTVNVKVDYGATGDGTTDDRAVIQAAIDLVSAAGGGTVYFPDGTYRLTRYSTTSYCLMLKDNVRILGESQTGTILKQAATIAASVRLFYTTGADKATVSTITLDGNKDNNTTQEHRHGMFIDTGTNLLVENVTAQNFTGDGFYVYTGSEHLEFRSCTAKGNERNGITFGAQCDDILVKGCTFNTNAVQQVDFEPAVSAIVSNVDIVGNTIDGTGSNDYAIAIGGAANDALSLADGITATGNTITGAARMVWCKNVVFSGNTITNSTTKSSVEVYRHTENIEVLNNSIDGTDTITSSIAGVLIQGTGVGDAPTNVTVKGNTITVDKSDQFGIRAEGCISVYLEENDITGAGVTSSLNSGIYVRATVEAEDFDIAVVKNNTIRNFGNFGVGIFGTGVSVINSLTVNENTIEDTSATPTITTGIKLDDGLDVAQVVICIDNDIASDITNDIFFPSSFATLIGYTDEKAGIWIVPQSPNSFLTESPGAVATLVSGGGTGARTTNYKKDYGTGNTGWVTV